MGWNSSLRLKWHLAEINAVDQIVSELASELQRAFLKRGPLICDRLYVSRWLEQFNHLLVKTVSMTNGMDSGYDKYDYLCLFTSFSIRKTVYPVFAIN